MHLENKIDQLHSILQGYGRVAVAFSGGTDSSLLLKCALDTLGAGNVLVLFGSSVLLKEEEQKLAETWLDRHKFASGVDMINVALQPLSWKEFVKNPEDRCYLCKLRIYKEFNEVMHSKGFTVLVDGTNIDDLKERRPGLRAIRELGVKNPLVQAGLDKSEIRVLSRQLGLDTWELPSASCLATRIPHGVEVTPDRIEQIAFWEHGLENLGFHGCRARMGDEHAGIVFIQVANRDMDRLSSPDMRLAVLRFFRNKGVKKVYFDLEGR